MKKIITSLTLTMSSIITFGQNDTGLTVAPEIVNPTPSKQVEAIIDVEIRTAFTTGEFEEAYSKAGMGGGGITIVAPIKQTILALGAELGYYYMGNTSSTSEYSEVGIGDYDVTSSFSGSMIPFHMVARIDPLMSSDFPIHPYIEGVAGFKVFNFVREFDTYIYRTDENLPTEKEVNKSLAWSYGFGGGIRVKITDGFFINAKAHKVFGSETKYTDTRSIEFHQDGTYSYGTTKSKTDVYRFTLGISIIP